MFAIAAMALMGAAALAFDSGIVLLERRAQQNAADAAALAGARYLPANSAVAYNQAIAVAGANGYTDGAGRVSVTVTFPTEHRIRVRIQNGSPSLFAGVLGIGELEVGSNAVATNESRPSGPFAMLSLSPTACPGIALEGSGVIRSSGNIQVNSACTSNPPGAFRVAGSGGLILDTQGIGCNVVGTASQGGGVSQNDCQGANLTTGATSIPDPYSDLEYPPIPAPYVDALGLSHLARPPVNVNNPLAVPPAGCPGSLTPATHATPNSCRFGGSYSGTTWRLFPGYYPGGIDLRSGTFLLEPGIYYVAGGCRESDCPRTGTGERRSFRAAGSGVTLRSVDSGGTTAGGGVLIFNGRHSATPPWPDGQIVLQGGNSDWTLLPLDQDTPWDNMVIFQHRAITQTISVVGGSSSMATRGIMYAAGAHILAQGNTGTLLVDQLIGDTVRVAGNGGTVNVAYNWDYLPLLRWAGLVE
jgi:hypothetical protein